MFQELDNSSRKKKCSASLAAHTPRSKLVFAGCVSCGFDMILVGTCGNRVASYDPFIDYCLRGS